TAVTGAAHWHVLLRARAIENQCYVLAAAQGGTHPGGRRTYGHSMLIDPWGVILAERDKGPGVVIGDIDAARLAQVRRDLPALARDRIVLDGADTRYLVGAHGAHRGRDPHGARIGLARRARHCGLPRSGRP